MLPDAGAAPDVRLDADLICESTLPDPVGAYRGKVGGLGGGKGPLLACDDVASERIVGVAWPMSKQARLVGNMEVAVPVNREELMLDQGVYEPDPLVARYSMGLEVGWR